MTIFLAAFVVGLSLAPAARGEAIQPIKVTEAEVPYGVADKMWDLSLGQHRALIHVESASPAVWAHLPWRLQMQGMDRHQIMVVDVTTGQLVRNVMRVAADRLAGDIVFMPATAPGDYYVYYLPLRPHGNLNDMSGYVDYTCNAAPAWLQENGLVPEALAKGDWRRLPAARVLGFEARTEFDRFDPMEVIASDTETKELLERFPQALLLFPEDRRHAIRMQHDLPLRWIQQGPRAEFEGEALRNEYFAFQVGLFAARSAANKVAVRFSALRTPDGREITASAMTCFNTGGIDSWGRPFAKEVNVPAGCIQPLWLGVDVASNQPPGVYSGAATVQAEGLLPQTVAIRLKVLPEIIPERGDNEPWRHSRLRWLNSTSGAEDYVCAPFTPLDQVGERITCLGREIRLGANGLPVAIQSGTQAVLAQPVRLVVDSPSGPLTFEAAKTEWISKSKAAIEWQTESSAPVSTLVCQGRMEYDGHLNFRLTLKPTTDLDLHDVRLELPFRPESAEYFMGAGRGGGLRPKDYLWKWTGPYDSFWLGSAHAGLHCELRGGTYHGPMLNLYHPAPPLAWGNGGIGGVSIREVDDHVMATVFSGPRKVRAGQPVTFEFALLITPVKPLDPETHFRTRYYHCGDNWTPEGNDPTPTAEALAAGVNVVNLHHASIYNPYINYPFLKTPELKRFTTEMHRKGVKVKIYDTVRELSNMVTELWALRSLGGEVILPGGGGGYAWCQEHMITGYVPSWFQRFSDAPPDASFVTSGDSRWYNYYVEGIGWLVRNADIDGIYLDDVTYDRHILQRVRTVMSREKPGCLIDLHSNTGFSIGPANQYAEFMPYIERPWFGESFNYNAMAPDRWLVEVSGIPFGLLGEMLHEGGNPWRGALYGMTVRLGWRTNGRLCDPRPVWKIWDRFDLRSSRMIGYWETNCPIRTSRSDVLASVHVKPGCALLALASWAPAKTNVFLTMDWPALGLDPAKTVLYAPASPGFQKPHQWKPADPISVAPGRGWLIILDETGPTAADFVAGDDKLDRSILLEETFARPLSADWSVTTSPHPGTSIAVGDGGLVIQAFANVSACVQRALPAGITAVECSIKNQNDAGETWGPGLALFWPGGQAIRLNLRTPDHGFGIDSTAGEQKIRLGWLESDTTVTLRIRIEPDRVIAEARNDGDTWQSLATFPRHQFPGAPARVNLGKMCGVQGTTDYASVGAPGSAIITSLRLYGK